MYSKLFDSTYCEIETPNSWSHKKIKKKKQDHLGLAIRALIKLEKNLFSQPQEKESQL